jgi:Protein of unknown function (DUF1302)
MGSRWVGLGLVAGLAVVGRANAFYLDAGRNFDFRARAYTEVGIAAEDTQPQSRPGHKAGQLLSHRNFINPEFEGKLTSYQPFRLDDVSFRLALWGFYDGIYDYGPIQYDHARRTIEGRLSRGYTATGPVTHNDSLIDARKQYSYQCDPVLGSYNAPDHACDLPFRINEAYFNVSKGPLFLRIGRQAISWGESDTIALLDANNPFDQTRGVTGLFEDVDEARIPLWTLRSTYHLFESWGPLSSGYLDAYVVPGSVDTTVSNVPLPLLSPYSPPQDDPQTLIAALVPPKIGQVVIEDAFGGLQVGLYDHLPSRSMSNSRFGVRLGGIVARDYTASLWYYRTFATQPVPRFLPLDLSRSPLAHPGAPGPAQLITELHHGLVDVFGAATSFFSEPADGIVRGEVEFFLGEPAFIPNENLPFERLLKTPAVRRLIQALGQTVPAGGKLAGSVPHADYMRFELGFDRFFFFRPANPWNSFTWVTAYVGQWNLTETFTNRDFRFGGQQELNATGTKSGVNTSQLKLGTISQLRTVAEDFVDQGPYESFVQTHLQTDYMHGRLSPGITAIVGLNGTYAIPMNVTYRFNDNLLFDLKYVLLGGAFRFPTGYFRDRSQIFARMTLLLN